MSTDHDARIAELVRRIQGAALATDKLEDSAQAANELLRELLHTGEVEALRPLLHSDDDGVTETAAWLASEIGASGSALVDDIVPLLRHAVPAVRFWAVDSVASMTEAANVDRYAAVAELLDDPNPGVRWKLALTLARARTWQLQSAIEQAEAHAAPLEWLLSIRSAEPREVTQHLADTDPRWRLVAAAAAVRLRDTDSGPLELATQSTDPVVERVARDALDLSVGR
jgi:hypothetical protein